MYYIHIYNLLKILNYFENATLDNFFSGLVQSSHLHVLEAYLRWVKHEKEKVLNLSRLFLSLIKLRNIDWIVFNIL